MCLFGPTASGKTRLSIRMAHMLDAEIISVDSALVYRGLDIGSAKPDAVERDGIAHHLIDVVEPDEPYSAARFSADALQALQDIAARGKRALLVGGTVLYFRALLDGLAPLPAADPALRARLLRDAEREGVHALHRRLIERDPVSAARLHPNDLQRVQRALEVFELTGVPMSTLHAATQPALRTPTIRLALVPERRSWLHARIAQRLGTMRAAGFDEEVRRLHAHGYSTTLPALRSVGYRQALDALAAGTFERSSDGGPPVWPEQAIAATRQLAKRQLTGLRALTGVHRIACDTLDADQQCDAALRIVQAGPTHYPSMADT